MAVIVPAHRRRDDQVARLHRAPDAVHAGEGAVPLDDQPERRGRVVVAGRGLAGQDDLQPREEGRGDGVRPVEAGVLQDEHATLRLLDRYKPCRLEQERAEVLPPPAVRHRGRHALVRQEDMEGGPERSQGEGVQRLPEGGREARVACRHHRSGTDDTRPRH
ncbi:MAG: hypothetical protein AUH09_00730 [Candidatus Rokubacteria bacterium 13_2_20CM_70_12]|nr:MAG: hypothetical protein AUH09_00730 [Candidatus Rokubacteria bacterium 13_2_20CM_70_12]